MNDSNFDIPGRQSKVAILLVIVNTFISIAKQLWPLLIVTFIGKRENNFDVFLLYMSVVITLISCIYSILVYYRTYFYIAGHELKLKTGLLRVKQLSIPLDKIQSVNFEQNILHKLFNVKKIIVDTAGSSEKEFSIQALSSDKAELLKQKLLSYTGTSDFITNGNELSSPDHNSEKSIQDQPIFSLPLGELIKAGLFQNHFKSIGLIFIAAWWLYTNLQDVGINTEDYMVKASAIRWGIVYAFILFTVLVLISILISLIVTILKYYNLSFYRTKKGFKIKRGLFNVHTISAMDRRIQSVSWHDTFLQKMIGIFDLRLNQARSMDLKSSEAILVPGCKRDHIRSVLDHLLEGKASVSRYPSYKIHSSYLYRKIIIIYLLSCLLFILCIMTGYVNYIWAVVLLGLYNIIAAWKGYHKFTFTFNDELIRIDRGTWGDHHVITPIYKIQSIIHSQSPFQRKRNLASLYITHASGTESIPYIDINSMYTITNLYLQKIESDRRSWM